MMTPRQAYAYVCAGFGPTTTTVDCARCVLLAVWVPRRRNCPLAFFLSVRTVLLQRSLVSLGKTVCGATGRIGMRTKKRQNRSECLAYRSLDSNDANV